MELKKKLMKILQADSSNRDKLERICVISNLDTKVFPTYYIPAEYCDMGVSKHSFFKIFN
jgi:hypothetical protein